MLQRVFAFLVPTQRSMWQQLMAGMLLSARAQASLSLLIVHFHPNMLQSFSLAKHDGSNAGFALEEGNSSLQRLQGKGNSDSMGTGIMCLCYKRENPLFLCTSVQICISLF